MIEDTARNGFVLALAYLVLGCSEGGEAGMAAGEDAAAQPGPADAASPPVDAEPRVPQYPELWYSVGDILVHLELDPSNGAVAAVHESSLGSQLQAGHNMLTMLADGSLLGGRYQGDRTTLYWIDAPPRDGSAANYVEIGTMIDGILLEALHVDCDGRIYAIDTGTDAATSAGNRLLRFTGDVLAGDLTYEVVGDLATAVAADLDDMSPGIVDNTIVDNPGIGIDSGRLYAINFQNGTGAPVAEAGTWGVHALGGSLFANGVARMYVLSMEAELFRIDPVSYAPTGPLVVGPSIPAGLPGASGLAGPLTECDSGFVVD